MCKPTKIDNHIVIRLRGKIIIHPDVNGDGQGHICVYLAIVGTSSLHADWEVNASFSFLIFDQIHDNYTVMRGMKRRFNNINTEWGFAKCVSHKTFKDPSNGYLVNDKCIFEVDLYVIKNQGVGECLSSSSGVKPYKHEWKINEITKLKNIVYSEKFTVKGYKCLKNRGYQDGDLNISTSLVSSRDEREEMKGKNILHFLNSSDEKEHFLYPTGDSGQNGQCISIFLQPVDAEGFDRQKKVKAKFSISMQNKISGEDRKETGNDTLS
ncbi:hypothetical protein BC332_12834 [Capsicum chinense]|nr:hypothetical protein BC332_12834 [Capsicum chinense]